MALMAAAGEITPMPVAAIFADTKGEPENVYRWLQWLSTQLPFPVLKMTKGSLEKRCLTLYRSEKSGKLTFASVPAFALKPNGEVGLIPRQCTRDFKTDVITKGINALRRDNGKCVAVSWLGISLDESLRAKDHRNSPRIINRFPLIELGMSRIDCLKWCKKNGYPEPPRSACWYCGFRKDSEWAKMKREEPLEFQKAVAFDHAYREIAKQSDTMEGTLYLHRSCKPLGEVDFSTEEERGQLNMFNNECEGMCGV